MTDIDNYICSLTATHSPITLDKYRKKLYQLKSNFNIDCNDEEALWLFTENSKVKLETKRLNQYILKNYRQFYQLPVSYFSEKLKKSNVGFYINTDNPVKINKAVKSLPDDYLQLINEIENKNHRLLLRLITGYDEVLRTDLAFVKTADIIDGVIKINESKKTKMSVNIELKSLDNELVDFTKEYLIELGGKDRSNSYTKLVKRITKLYLNIELSQTDFRHIKATELAKSVEHLPLQEQQVLLKEQASKRAHSVGVAITNYIDKTDDVNVSLDYKKTINLMKGDVILHTYVLEDVIKAMNLMNSIKNL